MAWLRKAQSIPPFPSGMRAAGAAGPVRGDAFLDLIGSQQAIYPEPDFTNNADYGFDKNELVYACIMEKATSLPEAPFRVFGPDGQGEPRENHPLRQLLMNPNPATTEFELIELTSIYLDLAGIAFWEIVQDRVDQPAELWPLRPDRVRIFPQNNGKHEYGYDLGSSRIVPLGTNVLAFKLPNPMNPILGQAPMRPANRAVSLDNEATDFVKTLLQNRAIPGTVIETESAIDANVTDRLTEKWMERFGRNNRGMPAFLQKGMKVQPLGLSPTQLEFPDLRTISESRICMAFGVPPILIGAKVGLDRSTFANYGEARRSFWEETLMPAQKRIQQVIVSGLLPRLEGPRPRRSVCRFDNSEVLALRESEGRRWELATQALRAGGITVNQFARYVGLPVTPDADYYLRPAGVEPVGADGKPLFEPEPVILRPPPPASDQPAEDQPAEEPADTTAGKMVKQVPQADREAFAKSIAAVVERERDEVMARIGKSKALLTLAPDKFKAEVWDRGKWNRALASAMEPHMRKIAYRGALKVAPDQPTSAMDGYIAAAAAGTARRWNQETEDAVSTATTIGGVDVMDAVDTVFVLAAGYRALRLAVSASTEMNGFGKVDTAKRAGVSNKTWVVTSGHPRPEHEAMDGETVPVSEPFSDGNMWPSGPNCQCDVEFTEGN